MCNRDHGRVVQIEAWTEPLVETRRLVEKFRHLLSQHYPQTISGGTRGQRGERCPQDTWAGDLKLMLRMGSQVWKTRGETCCRFSFHSNEVIDSLSNLIILTCKLQVQID